MTDPITAGAQNSSGVSPTNLSKGRQAAPAPLESSSLGKDLGTLIKDLETRFNSTSTPPAPLTQKDNTNIIDCIQMASKQLNDTKKAEAEDAKKDQTAIAFAIRLARMLNRPQMYYGIGSVYTTVTLPIGDRENMAKFGVQDMWIGEDVNKETGVSQTSDIRRVIDECHSERKADPEKAAKQLLALLADLEKAHINFIPTKPQVSG